SRPPRRHGGHLLKAPGSPKTPRRYTTAIGLPWGRANCVQMSRPNGRANRESGGPDDSPSAGLPPRRVRVRARRGQDSPPPDRLDEHQPPAARRARRRGAAQVGPADDGLAITSATTEGRTAEPREVA